MNYILNPLEQGSWEEAGPKQGRPPSVGGGLLQDLKKNWNLKIFKTKTKWHGSNFFCLSSMFFI